MAPGRGAWPGCGYAPFTFGALGDVYVCENERKEAKGCQGSWFRQSGGTLEVVGSISGRGEFPPPVKKTLSSASCPKHCGARPNLQGDGPRVRVGQGFGGFLGLL